MNLHGTVKNNEASEATAAKDAAGKTSPQVTKRENWVRSYKEAEVPAGRDVEGKCVNLP